MQTKVTIDISGINLTPEVKKAVADFGAAVMADVVEIKL